MVELSDSASFKGQETYTSSLKSLDNSMIDNVTSWSILTDRAVG